MSKCVKFKRKQRTIEEKYEIIKYYESIEHDEVNEIDVNETSIDENIESYSNISCKEVLELSRL